VKHVEIVAMVRNAYAAYSRRDFDRAAEILHPDVELLPAGSQPPIRGAERVRAWMEPDAFDEQVLELLDSRVIGDKVLAHQRSRARGATSGIELEFDTWSVMTLDRDGSLRRVEIYLDRQRAEALESAASLFRGC
jgi:ketosteroid isomerase-like protein